MDGRSRGDAPMPGAARGEVAPAAHSRGPRSVLVPLPPLAVDPARVAESALPLARTVAQRTGAPLTLLSVVEQEPPFNPLTRMAAPAAPDVGGESPVAEAEAQLAGVAEAVPTCPVETVVRTGSPAAEIRSVIAERTQPLLVLCSHTRTGLDRLLYGSITGELVRTATCPVLVVRGRQPAATEGVAPLHTVVVPLDQSALAEQALARALTALGPADLHRPRRARRHHLSAGDSLRLVHLAASPRSGPASRKRRDLRGPLLAADVRHHRRAITATSRTAPSRPAACSSSSSPSSRRAPRRRARCGGRPSTAITTCIPTPSRTCTRRGTRASSTRTSAGSSTGKHETTDW